MKRLIPFLALLLAAPLMAGRGWINGTGGDGGSVNGSTSLSGGNAASVVFLDSSSKMTTSSLFTFQPLGGLNVVSLTGSGSWGASQLGWGLLNSYTMATVGSNEVHANTYAPLSVTSTVDNTANAAHVISRLNLITDNTNNGTDLIVGEDRANCRSLVANQECTATLAYLAAVSTQAVTGVRNALEVRACETDSNGDCSATATAFSPMTGIYVNMKGGNSSSRWINFSANSADKVGIIASSNTVFSATDISASWNTRVGIQQADGGDLRPALAFRSGAAGSNLLVSFGGASDLETDFVRVGAANAYATGTSQGDFLTATLGTGQRLWYSVGFNAIPELGIGNGYVLVGSTVAALGGILVAPPAAQTIGAGGTVAADACGGLKMISSAGTVTTDTTNTFTVPGLANKGCCMDVENTGANQITLDANGNFFAGASGTTDVVMTTNDSVRVCSTGTQWRQVTALLAK